MPLIISNQSTMDLPPENLENITAITLDHYNQRAEDFWEGTRDHDVRQNVDALLQHIMAEPPFKILDFGCGPGRDLKAFADGFGQLFKGGRQSFGFQTDGEKPAR